MYCLFFISHAFALEDAYLGFLVKIFTIAFKTLCLSAFSVIFTVLKGV